MCTNDNANGALFFYVMLWISFILFGKQLQRAAMCRRIVASLLCIVLMGACERQAVAPRLAEGLPFPAVNLSYSGGNALSAAEFQGKFIVLNVWATWCPPCRREMPSLERLSQKLDPKRFAVIGMSTDADERLASEFLLQNDVTFANFFDINGALAKQWGLKVYPETFLIAPDGTLVQRVVGLREWDSPDMMVQLESLYQRHAPQSVASKWVVRRNQ